jgi:hypothetical protein
MWVTIGIEDQNGWAMGVILNNFPHTETMSNEELETLFPLNTVIAIREPYPTAVVGRDNACISIDSPSDFVFLEPGDSVVSGIAWGTGNRPFPQTTRTGSGWKELGNQHFKSKQFFAAVIAYTFGLRQSPSVDLRLNRALAYLRLGNFTAALGDAKDALQSPSLDKNSKLKALYRAAQSSYGRGDYASAIEYYGGCLVEDVNAVDAKLGIKRCGQRIKEQTGQYDWMDIFEQQRFKSPRLDVSEYQGPIKVVSMKNRGGGRGVIATRDIKTGEVLVSRVSL